MKLKKNLIFNFIFINLFLIFNFFFIKNENICFSNKDCSKTEICVKKRSLYNTFSGICKEHYYKKTVFKKNRNLNNNNNNNPFLLKTIKNIQIDKDLLQKIKNNENEEILTSVKKNHKMNCANDFKKKKKN